MTSKRTHLVHLNNYMSDKPNESESNSKNKKKVTKKEQTSEKLPDLDPAIAKVIRDALLIKLAENQHNIDKACELEAMISTVQEFMSSFIILGYDMNHQPIQPIVFAHNQQEADSLGAYLSKFIHHNIKEIDPNAE